jgi:hypothetical protein
MRQGFIALVLILALVSPLIFRGGFVIAGDKKLTRPLQTATNEAKLKYSEATASAGNQINISSNVNYTLPYPGILPDHPLYPVKALRDRILEFLIRDPQRKADFYLLMADKRLNMGIALTEKRNYELAESTIFKGEEYFLKGANLLESEKIAGSKSITSGQVARYKTAAIKHLEVIRHLQKESLENVKKGYERSIKLVRQTQEELEGLGK